MYDRERANTLPTLGSGTMGGEANLASDAENVLALIPLHDAAQHCFADPHNTGILQTQKILFRDIVTRAANYQTDKTARQVLRTYAEAVDYLWFQPYDAPVPPAMIYRAVEYRDNRQWGDLQLDRGILGQDTFEAVTVLLGPFGLQELLHTRSANFADNQSLLVRALKRFGAATPAGRWLRAFTAAHTTRQARLTPGQLILRQAAVFNEVTLPMRQFGHVSTAILRSGARRIFRNINRRYMALDDDPGRRSVPRSGMLTPRTLASFIARNLINQVGDDASYAGYDAPTKTLTVYQENGEALEEYEGAGIALALQEVDLLARARTYASDNFSLDVFDYATQQAFKSAEDTYTPGEHIYTNALGAAAAQYVSLIAGGFQLATSVHFETATDVVKRPPPNSPFTNTLYRGNSVKRVTLRGLRPRSEVQHEPSENDDSGAAFNASLRDARTETPCLATQLEQARQGLIDDLRRCMAFPEDTPESVVLSALSQRRIHDPTVYCLGSLYRALDELHAGSKVLSPARLTELAQALDYVQSLRDLQRQPHRHDPEGYAQQPELLDAMERALGPVADQTRPYRYTPT